MDEQKPRNKDSRRSFLNRSVLTAAAGAFVAKKAAAADATPGSIKLADAFNTAIAATPKPAAFPMRGAQVFAKVCKEEGLAAMFCCPGNYGVINAIAHGTFSPDDHHRYRELVDGLRRDDYFMVTADFDSYFAAQRAVDERWRNPESWWRAAIANTANVGYFSSDRTIREYARDVWDLPGPSSP